MQGKLLYGIGGIVIGLVAGFFAANSLNRQAISNATTVSSTSNDQEPAASSAASQAGGMQADVEIKLQKAEKEPTNFVAQMQAGDMYAQIGRFDKAVDFYKRGVALNPQNQQANIVLANALFDSQKFEEAGDFYTKALLIDPKNVNAITDLGTTFVERKEPDYDRAIAEFRKALEIDAKNAPTLYYLGIAQLRKGEKVEAEKTLAELVKADPTSDLIGRLRENLNPPTR